MRDLTETIATQWVKVKGYVLLNIEEDRS